jgi:hypothetical protein
LGALLGAASKFLNFIIAEVIRHHEAIASDTETS